MRILAKNYHVEVTSDYTTPVMYTDSTGYLFGLDDDFTGPVDELILLALLAIAAWVGIPGASDALDELSIAIGNTISNIRDEIKKVVQTASVAIALTVATTIQGKNVAAYVIQFSD